jgi:hypothetical protein
MNNKKWSYLKNGWGKGEDLSNLVTYFHNGSGYRIVVYKDTLEGNIRVRVSDKWSAFAIGIISSGFPREKGNVYSCIEDLDKIMNSVRDKTTRRFFIRTVRKLALYDGLYIKDFLTNDGRGDRIDWEKVREYEKKYYPESW